MKRYDMIIDFETFGLDLRTCPVIDMSFCIFNWENFVTNPYTFDKAKKATAKLKLSVEDQTKNYGKVICNDTLKFWSEQSKESRKFIAPTDKDLTVEQFRATFLKLLSAAPKVEYWWSRSNAFDPVLLYFLMGDKQSIENKMLEEYLHNWRVRDVRTFIDAKLDFPPINKFFPGENEETASFVNVEHDSRCDVVMDLLRLQAIHRAECDLDMVKI